MTPLKLSYGRENISFEAPDSWADVPFYKFEEFQNEGHTPEEVYELFTDIPADWWRKPHLPEFYNAIDGQLAFLSEEPITEVPTHLERDGVYYKIKKDFLNVPLGKYRDLIEITKQVTEESSNTVSVMPKMIAIFACDTYEDEDELNKIAEEIKLMPTDIVYSLGCFFLQKLNGLRPGTQKKWYKVIAKKIFTILMQVLTKSLASLAIFILFLISPKVMLQSTKLFIIKRWQRFIGHNKLKVESIKRKPYTVD